ncbi:MAG: redoxin domain-containing protein [Saprospiraceae bacterium]|nr:redoxin domain-containing protein [Saprospiraceae bacterium]
MHSIKKLSLVFILQIFLGSFLLQSQVIGDQYNVYFFLLEDCKITQSYIPEIKQLYNHYQNDSINMLAIYSAPSSNNVDIQSFHEKYKIPLKWKLDSLQSLAKLYNITVMPEVMVVNTTTNTLVYQGRIDDRWAAIGKRKNKAEINDLQNCLDHIILGKTPEFYKTQAVGCYLTKL